MSAVIKRLVFVPAFLFFILGLVPLFALSLFTWIITGHNLDAQLDWYLDTGEKLIAWAGGASRDSYPWD